jgi:hypothetical protein
MPRVLFLSSADPTLDLGGTVLFRKDVERTLHRDPKAALADALSRPPNLIVVRAESNAPRAFIHDVKRHAETRRVSIVVLALPSVDAAALKAAGASLVLHGPVDPLQWDERLDELLNEPPRKDTRIPARFVIWPRPLKGSTDCVALNLSVRGMLLEAQQPLALGTTLELRFQLPGEPRESEVVGQVVRQAAAEPGQLVYGIDFVVLRGDSHESIQRFVEAHR